MVVGPNGAGKSTVLQAIDLLGGVVRGTLSEHLSLGLDVGLTLLWEYVIEFKEYVSLNDLIFNVHAGLAIGEPMRRASVGLRAAGGGPVPGGMAAFAAPFDFAHGYLARPSPLDATTRTRFELLAGSGAWFDGGRRSELTVGATIQVVGIPGFSEPGRARRRVGLAATSRIEGSQAFGADRQDVRRTAARLLTRTALFGAYERQLVETPDGLHGHERVVSIGTGFTYDTRLLAAAKDRLTLAHLAGGQLLWRSYRGAAAFWLDAGLYADFGMVQALVFGPMVSVRPEEPLTSALAERGYYFGGGGTAELRIGAELRWLRVEGDVRSHVLFAIDGLDRREMGGPEDPHGVNDQRLLARLRLGAGLGPGPFRLSATLEHAERRGAWQDRARWLDDTTLGVDLSVAL